jgi:hypothetical protein
MKNWDEETKKGFELLRSGLRQRIDEIDERFEPIKRLLDQHSGYYGHDLTTYCLYGSTLRPMSHSWARIKDAIYIQDGKQTTEFHTIIATPEPLTQAVIKQFELTTL